MTPVRYQVPSLQPPPWDSCGHGLVGPTSLGQGSSAQQEEATATGAIPVLSQGAFAPMEQPVHPHCLSTHPSVQDMLSCSVHFCKEGDGSPRGCTMDPGAPLILRQDNPMCFGSLPSEVQQGDRSTLTSVPKQGADGDWGATALDWCGGCDGETSQKHPLGLAGLSSASSPFSEEFCLLI